MIEVVIILGLLFILGLTVILHIASTADIPYINETTRTQPDTELHPWYISIEVILLITIIYVGSHMI